MRTETTGKAARGEGNGADREVAEGEFCVGKNRRELFEGKVEI